MSNEWTRVLSGTDIQKRRKIRKIIEELSTFVHKYQLYIQACSVFKNVTYEPHTDQINSTWNSIS